ncbi:MAG TPA: ABC transporter permease [Dehalococcoidia bacterium]
MSVGVSVPWFSHRAFRVWERHLTRARRMWRLEMVPPLVEPVVLILALGLGLGTYVELGGDRDYMQFLVPGVLAIFPVFAAIEEGLWGAYFRMEEHGTYQAIMATPASVEDIILGDLLWSGTRVVINSVMILAVALAFTPVYGLVTTPLVLLALPVGFVHGVFMAAACMAYTSRAVSLSTVGFFFSLIIAPMFWFSGVFFPLEGLPDWLQTAAWFIPIAHAVEINRALADAALRPSLLGDLLWLVAGAVACTYVAVYLMRQRLVK